MKRQKEKGNRKKEKPTRVLARLLLVLAVCTIALAGCIDSHVFGLKEAEHKDPAKRPPTVYPHQVDESNGHAMAQALDAEMDFDARREDVKTPPR